ncbi:Major heat shock protein Ab [Araneus ventricosus]|uniref:Major heat shock protein Ab n=1 Tax=Araneus ventricosus TaxID=182803 RepID=A0A4Y2JW82_ARAVE|nr:Major heat shock protein Ab [Araneus ventricosus]
MGSFTRHTTISVNPEEARICIPSSANSHPRERAHAPAICTNLGTTYSWVGVIQHGKVEIIANDQENRTTPSVVAFTETGRLIGEPAKSQIAKNPKKAKLSMRKD